MFLAHFVFGVHTHSAMLQREMEKNQGAQGVALAEVSHGARRFFCRLALTH
jgi:hypothetical protein